MALVKFSKDEFYNISQYLKEEDLILLSRTSKGMHEKINKNLLIKNKVLKY